MEKKNNAPLIYGIIPARFASSRFPGKPLVDLGGKTMIQRVYEQCLKSKELDKVVVATDDERIAQNVASFNGEYIMTRPDHISGTDRIAELVEKVPDLGYAINIQGDEPFIEWVLIDALALALKNTDAQIVTAAIELKDHNAIFNPNTVKVVFNQKQEALYFSRSPIPHQRNTPRANWLSQGQFYQHIGIYGFERNTLLELAKAPPGGLEQQESLEQLRWMEMGKKIYIHLTDKAAIGIDTPEDIAKIQHLL